MSQSINLRALRWAYEEADLKLAARAVLMSFALHANEKGYTYPSLEFIADRWGMDRKTVRRQIEVLLVRRKIYHTKKRCGSTGQVKVYRLPKITYGSGGKCTRFESDPSGDRAWHKRSISGGEFPPNNEYDRIRNKISDSKALGSSLADGEGDTRLKSSPVFSGSYQNHIKYPEYAAWCRSQGGSPTAKGFDTWLRKQKPHWRNKVKAVLEESGYVLDGRFYTSEEANRRSASDFNLILKFRRAIRRDGKIEIIEKPSWASKNGNWSFHSSEGQPCQ